MAITQEAVGIHLPMFYLASGDTKPETYGGAAQGTDPEPLPVGSKCYVTDSQEWFVWTGTAWIELIWKAA